MATDERTERFWGIVLPLAVCVYALYAASDGQIEIRGRHGGLLVLVGFDLLLFVAACMAAAGTVHAAWFWANTRHDAGYSQLGQLAGLLVFLVAVVWLVARQLVPFV